MDEYIKKETLYEKIAQLEELARNRCLETPSNSQCHLMCMAQLNERTAFKHIIADSPSVDVAPVEHGRWERDEWGSYLRRCSVCKKSPIYKDERGNSVAVYAGVCINCGAKMYGGDNA